MVYYSDAIYYLFISYHFEVHHTFLDESNKEKVSYTHTLSKGKTTEKHYGKNRIIVFVIPSPFVKLFNNTFH